MNNNSELLISNYDANAQKFTVEVPLIYLTDPLLMNLMLEPVLSPSSGETYHRNSYIQALNSNHNHDPTTREYVSADEIVNNPILREINFSIANRYPQFDAGLLDEINAYVKNKTGHGIKYFKHRHPICFGGVNGLYRLLKFADGCKNNQSLKPQRVEFSRQHYAMQPELVVTRWDEQNEKFTIRIPEYYLICPELGKMMADPITFFDGTSCHLRNAPESKKQTFTFCKNNFLKTLSRAIFRAMPQLTIFSDIEILRDGVLSEDVAFLSAAINQYPQKINELIDYDSGKPQTALMFAIQQKKTASIRQLLESDHTDITVVDHQGKSALDYAKEVGEQTAVQKLAFPLLVEPLLKNDPKFQGRGQKISDETRKTWLPNQVDLLQVFKNKVQECLDAGERVEALDLLLSAKNTTNFFTQTVNAFPTCFKIRLSILGGRLRLSKMTAPGEQLREFIEEKEQLFRNCSVVPAPVVPGSEIVA